MKDAVIAADVGVLLRYCEGCKRRRGRDALGKDRESRMMAGARRGKGRGQGVGNDE